jgi:hypothetical protein
MSELEMLETTTAATVERFVAEVTAAPGHLPECFDNRPSWDNWNKR